MQKNADIYKDMQRHIQKPNSMNQFKLKIPVKSNEKDQFLT